MLPKSIFYFEEFAEVFCILFQYGFRLQVSEWSSLFPVGHDSPEIPSMLSISEADCVGQIVSYVQRHPNIGFHNGKKGTLNSET